MKKISPFFALFIGISFGLNAQNISFENTEGYVLGNINGQKNWSTTSDGNGGFISKQVITDEMSSVGTYALKLTTEPSVEPQYDPMVGAFYTFDNPISSQAAVFSADIYLSEQSATSFRNYMALVDLEGNRYRTYFDFFFNGDINVFVKGGPTGIQMVYTGKKWTAATWFNAKIETLGDSVKFHINDELVYRGLLVSTGAIDQVRFIHDNYSGSTYIDNFIVNGETLSTKSPIADVNFTHFYNNDIQSLILESSSEQFKAVSVYNSLGQKVISKQLSQNSEVLDVTSLENGVYIAKLDIGNSTKTIKFFKQ